jgi:hypothetical protein
LCLAATESPNEMRIDMSFDRAFIISVSFRKSRSQWSH